MNKIYQIFVLNLLPNAPDWLIDGYMLDFILILFLYLPAALDTKYRSLMIFSYIKSFMTIIFLVLCVYWFVRRYVKDGFDPSDSVVIFFSSKEDYISCISEFVGSYISFPFLFVAINPMYNLTFNRANHMVKVIYIIYFLTLEIFGLFQYFTIYNIQGEVPFLYVMNGYHWSIRVARIVFMEFLACTLPALVEPMRQSMIFIIEVTDNMPKFVWCSMAILCLIASALFSTLTTRYYLLLTKLATAASMFMQFIVPPLLLLKQMDVMPKWHWVLIVLFIIGGTGITIYSIASIYELF
ncbi:hypothetical protein TRFO_20247 [Tritrichomonas foetus]|uniref:Amino acid transporter transmembrane domain-containing protein n=1 Tax=Tritrichomonas foetus TaxID=1144522 RepID=A0A1J4KGX3_9EUKA|nr:hypothetical protein TRFO_20247 [Tritrichomonas foetus]|eukprot:OHT10443.1 hypothetical protein TRFO_20247 [Tritrichomonas foetus]